MPLYADEREKFLQSQAVLEQRRVVGAGSQRSSEIEALCQKLCEHSGIFFAYQAERAFKKYADAIVNGIKIFVSYKIGSGEAASNIIEPFKFYGNGRILNNERFPYMCERVPDVGKDYREKIYAALEESHWFFLLLPDQSLDRSWTLFEAGYFKRAMAIEDRLIGIHHSKVEMAGPLTNLEAVRAEKETIAGFLAKLLHGPNPVPGMNPVNPSIPVDLLEKHAERIAQKIQPSREIWRQYRIDYLDIKLRAGHAPSDILDFLDSVVLGGNGLEKIFGYTGRIEGVSIERIIHRSTVARERSISPANRLNDIKQSSHRYWLSEIVKAIQTAVESKPYEPSEAILIGEDDRFYRPTLLSVRRYQDTDDPESAHIAFHESVTGPIRNCPVELSTLGTVLRMGFRFKWEVLENFRNIRTERDVESVRRLIERMEREGHQRGYYQPDLPIEENFEGNPIIAAFAPEQQEMITKMFVRWSELRNPDGTGRLDLAFKRKNATEVRKCLDELKILNKEFMRLACPRYAELVSYHWD